MKTSAAKPARNFDTEHDAAATLARDAYRAHGPRSAAYADAMAAVASIARAASSHTGRPVEVRAYGTPYRV